MTQKGEDVVEHVDARVTRTRNDVLAAAISVLVEEGFDALTLPHVAKVAGYSKATLYTHWPTRLDLVRDALAHFGQMPHHVPTGDLRADLVAELVSFRSAMVERRLDRAMTVLVELAATVPELAEACDRFVADGERVMRGILAPYAEGDVLEAATVLLCGAVVHTSMLHREHVTDGVIEAAVDLVVRGLEA